MIHATPRAARAVLARSVLVLLCACPLAAAAQAPAAPPAEPQETPPSLLTFVEAPYPRAAQAAGIAGVVTLVIEVDATGSPGQVKVLRGLGHGLDEAAAAAAKKFRFSPARRGDLTLPAVVTFDYKFTPPPPPPPVEARVPEKPRDIAQTYSTTVLGDRPITAASAMTIRDQDLLLRPVRRVGDLLRVTPGLITVQHAGGGKANQYFLRGFDADHGTDVSLTLDGIPINMVTHAHGQGYSDTNFIIPEMIERVEVFKGPYFLEWGDFATAGAINLVSKKSFGENFVQVSGGAFNTIRALGVASPNLGKLRPLLMAEISHTDGPFLNPENFNKYNVFGKLSYDFTPTSTLSLAVSSYGGDWAGSGQIPDREVNAGRLDFFGTLDPTEGGNTARHNVYLSYQLRPDAKSEFQALVFYTRYTLKLYSNFTLFAKDPVHGDGIEQGDERNMGGMRASYRRRLQHRWLTLDSTLGANVRFDDIHNTLFHQQARERLDSVVDHNVRETSIGVYLKEDLSLTRYVRLVGGLRADMFFFDVTDNKEDLGSSGTKTSGVRGTSLVSPKASLIVSPHRTVDLFANFGYGYHSNDARGVVRGIDPVTPLTPALGYEVGARTRLLNRLDLAASFWGLDLDSEQVWVGDEGTTEESGKTRRLGFEFEGRMRLLDWLFADLDITVNDAQFTQNAGNGNSVALAPRFTLAGGLSALTRFGLKGSVRVTGITDRPATEDGELVAEGWWVFDAAVSYRWRLLEVGLSVENFTDRRYKSAQFATTSRLRTDPPTDAPPPPGACPQGSRVQTQGNGNFAGCEDVHFSPGYPINVQARAAVYF